MIKTWKNATSRKVYEGVPARRFSSLDLEVARRRLRALDHAATLSDLGALKSVGLHKLKGARSGAWAISVNGPWRVCFRFRNGNAYDVEIVDYHRG